MGRVVHKVLRFDRFVLDLTRGCLRAGEQEIGLRPKAFQLLTYLAVNAGRLVPKQELVDAVWPNVVVSDESLAQSIWQLRQKLGDDAHRLIKTVARRGYVLDVVIEAADVTGVGIGEPTKTGAAPAITQSPDRDPGSDGGNTACDALAGERKQATVLCLDLKDSLDLITQRDPEEAANIFEAVIKVMTQAVYRYEGTVSVVTCDGMVALFGVPLSKEDHAVRACCAALEIREAVKRYAYGLQQVAGSSILVRAGLDSGEVVVRPITHDWGTQYRALGSTMHLATRLGQIGAPGTLLVSAKTLRLIEGHFQVKPSQQGNAGSANYSVYELIGAGQAKTRFQVLAERGLTTFVGRHAEMQQLERLKCKAQQGRGQVITIIGEPGVGKSRVVHEFARQESTSSWLVLATASLSYHSVTHYQPITGLLKTYFGVSEGDNLVDLRCKVTRRLLDLDRALMPDLPAFLALLDIGIEEPPWQALDAFQRRQRTLDALKRLILRECQRQPVILAFEDLHWIDSETQAVVETLIDGLASAPLLLILTYRPEYEHHWGGRSYYTQVHLDPLSSETTEEFLRSHLGDDDSLIPVKELLQSQGNPLFLEESVRTLIETNFLEGAPGNYRLVRHLQGLPIPSSVTAILAARIDRLPARNKRLLQAASVIGKNLSHLILHAITRLGEIQLRQRLAQLQEAEFLYEARLLPTLEYAFKHAVTQEVAYGSLLAEERKALHLKIVAAIEELFPDRLTEFAEQLAHHAVRGNLREKAVQYLQGAGAKAFMRSSNREAVAYYEQALAALAELPQTRETRQQAIDIRCDLRSALYPLAEYGRIEKQLLEAENLARELGDQVRLGWVSAYTSSLYLTAAGRTTAAHELAQRAEAIAEALGESRLHDAARYYLGWASYNLGNLREAERICRSFLNSLNGKQSRAQFGVVIPAVQLRGLLARTLAERGYFDEGDAFGQDAIRLAEEYDHPFSLCWECFELARVKSLRGELSQAAGLLERALAQCHRWKIGVLTPILTALLGYVYALSGRVEKGMLVLQQAMTDYESYGIEHFFSISVTQFGEVCLLADQTENAKECANRALLIAGRRCERGFEAWATRLLGKIAGRQEGAGRTTAIMHYRTGLATTIDLGMRPLAAHFNLELGKQLESIGQLDLAQEHLSTAAVMYRNMNMSTWLQEAETELKRIGRAR
jgi:class 3 adenylate cyclase/tetratricopeptide (TPR) repeat protein